MAPDILSLFWSSKFSLGNKINVKVEGNTKGTLKVRVDSSGKEQGFLIQGPGLCLGVPHTLIPTLSGHLSSPCPLSE